MFEGYLLFKIDRNLFLSNCLGPIQLLLKVEELLIVMGYVIVDKKI